MNNALLAIAGFIIVAVAALTAIPTMVDWNGYRGVFEEEASRILGRDVRVGGAVNVRFLPVPYVSFGKLRIADTSTDSGEPLFRADSFTLWLALPPLLRGALEAREIEIKKPVVRVSVSDKGIVNWSSLALTPGSLPFVPASVALQSVRLIDGRIIVQRANGSLLNDIDAVSGELAADALNGPYRFQGTLLSGGKPREVRLSTAPPAADGSVRLRMSVRVPASSNAYTLDGRVSNMSRVPRVDGELVAALSVPAPAGSAKAAPPIDLRGHVEADGTGLRLKDIALSLDTGGRPQLMTGTAEVAWVDLIDTRVDLTARWLDLDQLAGAGSDSPPLRTAQMLIGSVLDGLPMSANFDGRLTVDQLSVRKQPVSGLRLHLSRKQGPLQLDEFKAGLPGGTRIEASGVLAGQAPAAELLTGQAADVQTPSAPVLVAFQGDVSLRGANLARFGDWALPAMLRAIPAAERPFLVQGHVGLSDSELRLDAASAEIAGTEVTGDVRYAVGGRRRLDVRLEANALDLAKLWHGGVPPDELWNILGAQWTATGEPQPATADGQSPLDLRLRLRAGEISVGAEVLHDVTADLGLEGGALRVPRLRLATAGGLEFELDGAVAPSGPAAKGSLRYVLRAPGPEAVASLVRFAQHSGIDPAAIELMNEVGPIRLAGHVTMGERAAGSTDIDADGLIGNSGGGGRLEGSLRLDGGWQNWRTQPLALTLGLDGADILALIGRLREPLVASRGEPRKPLPAIAPPPGGLPSGPGRLTLAMAGTPAAGLTALADLTGPQLAVAWNGHVFLLPPAAPDKSTSSAPTRPSLDGTMTITSADPHVLAAIAGLDAPRSLRGLPLAGTLSTSAHGQDLDFAATSLTVAGQPVSGHLTLIRPTGKPTHLAGEIAVARASLPSLLAALVDASAPPTDAMSANGLPPAIGAWADRPFDLHGLDHIEGRVAVTASQLGLADGMTLTDAHASVDFSPGHIKINHLTAAPLKGKLDATVALTKAPAGITFEASGTLGDAHLEALPGGGDNRKPEGPVAISLTLTGQALSPAALLASLKGHGEIALGAASLGGMRPDAVALIADGVLAGRIDAKVDGAVTKAIAAGLSEGRLIIGPQRLGFDIADGAAQIAPLTIETPAGRTTLTTSVDLAGGTVDGEWQIEANRQPAGQAQAGRTYKALPPVGAVYVGPLKELGAIEPRWSTGPFERELTVRKMEAEVETLERQRREDEARTLPAAVPPATTPIQPAGAPAEGSAQAAPAEAAPPPPEPEPSGRSGLTRAQARSKALIDNGRSPSDYVNRGLMGH